MRKKDEKRCKKGQESTIGKIIYGFLLFMPLFAIGTTCLISTFNMSAKEETEINYKYETNEVNSVSNLVSGNIYNLDLDGRFGVDNSYVKGLYLFNVEDEDEELFDVSFIDNEFIGIVINESLRVVDIDIDGYFNLSYYFTPDSRAYVVFNSWLTTEQSFAENLSISDYSPIESVETHNVNAQDIFYRSVDKVTTSPLFNWAENSIIYTTTNATCNALSITTPFIPLLLSYWLIISVIYFLYDIALMLVWMIHRKIHELQESL